MKRPFYCLLLYNSLFSYEFNFFMHKNISSYSIMGKQYFMNSVPEYFLDTGSSHKKS